MREIPAELKVPGQQLPTLFAIAKRHPGQWVGYWRAIRNVRSFYLTARAAGMEVEVFKMPKPQKPAEDNYYGRVRYVAAACEAKPQDAWTLEQAKRLTEECEQVPLQIEL